MVRWQRKGTAMRYKDIYFAYTELGKTRMAGKTAHFPKVVRYIFLQFHPIQFATVCVCVCSFKGYVSFWAATLDTTPPILLLTRTHLNSTYSLITFLFLTCRRCANFPRSSVAMSPCTFIVKYYNCRYSRRPPRCVYEYRSV